MHPLANGSLALLDARICGLDALAQASAFGRLVWVKRRAGEALLLVSALGVGPVPHAGPQAGSREGLRLAVLADAQAYWSRFAAFSVPGGFPSLSAPLRASAATLVLPPVHVPRAGVALKGDFVP